MVTSKQLKETCTIQCSLDGIGYSQRLEGNIYILWVKIHVSNKYFNVIKPFQKYVSHYQTIHGKVQDIYTNKVWLKEEAVYRNSTCELWVHRRFTNFQTPNKVPLSAAPKVPGLCPDVEGNSDNCFVKVVSNITTLANKLHTIPYSFLTM